MDKLENDLFSASVWTVSLRARVGYNKRPPPRSTTHCGTPEEEQEQEEQEEDEDEEGGGAKSNYSPATLL